METATLNDKRTIDEVDGDLLSLTAQEASTTQEQRRKKRRYQYAPMTQYPETQDGSQCETSEGSLESTLAGYIKKVTLRNFMCHEHFELQLGPRLNFIVGNNGSGKSAILTAITIGLGAKASDTNRGTALKDLIKEGCHSAKITLHLDNSEHGAYNQGKFGNEIIVERTIKKDGPTSFSLRSETGKEISNKKKDIQAVVDYFSVPINNPMCFLSQDAARSFLTASTAHDKYNHFMKGTLLQEITAHLDHARVINNSAQENMALHLRNLNSLKEEYEDAKKLLRELNETNDLNQKKRLLQGKSLWIDVEQNKRACKKLESEIKTFESKVQDISEKINIRKDKIERYTVDKTAIEKELEDKVLCVADKDSEHQDARDLLRNVKSKFEKEKNNQAEARANIAQCKKNLQTLSNTIAHLEQELKREMGGDKDQMRQEISQLETRNVDIRDVVNSLSSNLQDLQNDEKGIILERHLEVKNAEQSILHKKNELGQIAQGNSSFLNNFDDNMLYLLQTIQRRSNEFESRPIGPLASFVTVKKGFEKWTRSIQRAVSSSLSSFVVKNQKDNKLFREIIRSCKIRANIPVMTYRLNIFDYSNGKSQDGFPTIADALDFSKPEIECLFVDQNKIEKVVLIEDKNEAREFLKHNPRNVKMALALRDQRTGFQIIGGYRLDTISYQDKIRLKIGSSSDDSIKYLKDLIDQETNELQNIKESYEQRLSSLRLDIRSADKEERSTRREIKENNARITELKMNVGKVVDTGTLTSKNNEKKRQEQAIAGYQAALEELDIRIEQIAHEAQPLKEKYDSTRVALLDAEVEMQHLKEDINNRHARVQKFKDDIKHYEEKNKSYKEGIDKAKKNLEVLLQGVQVQVGNACEFCSKEQSEDSGLPDNQEAIKHELEKISRMILRAENKLGLSRQEVIEVFEKSRDKYKEGQEKYLEIDKALDMLYKSIQVRLQNLQSAQRTTCLDADLDFRASLRVRNFSGNLSFITSSKRLEIYILTSNDEKARNVETLSGGEKSFSQMALLLATWKPMRSRIIALDEFDVFMDQVNRRIGTGLILKKLKDTTRTQTIIITPQDIGKIADIDSSGVNIHKMRDPQRQNNSNYYN